MKTGWFGTELCKTMSKKGHAVQTSFSIYQNSPKFEFKGTECMEELEKKSITNCHHVDYWQQAWKYKLLCDHNQQ
jgi:hypothetical protein